MIRSHPSATTKSRILNGIDIVVGGSIIIPIDIRVDATTISMIRNGIYIKNPMINAIRSSFSINAAVWRYTVRRPSPDV